MLKEFIKHVQETALPEVKQIDGAEFALFHDHTEEVRSAIDHPDTLSLNSLDALIKMVKTEGLALDGGPLYITIPDHLNVRCFASPEPCERWHRQLWYRVSAADVPGFRGGYRDHEAAIIELRSMFAPNAGTDYLLDLLSRISKESAVTSSDNGVSQTVEARQGISLKAQVQIKPRVSLRPYRTFQEVEQPESEFLLRLNDNGDIGLFEADGGMWKLTARQTVKKYLEEALKEEIDAENVIIAL